MSQCLIALGSNVGDRTGYLRQALGNLSRLPASRLLARSAWHETPPAGGPAGQGAFLNGVALVATGLDPLVLLAKLQGVETLLGRVRGERWGARVIDLDLLLYDGVEMHSTPLTLPHPRMAFRRFVLEGGAEVAPWMLHAESGWTVGALLAHLNGCDERIAVAGVDEQRASWLGERLAECVGETIEVALWPSDSAPCSAPPKLLLAPAAAAGVDRRPWRRMLRLPSRGPVAWISDESPEDALHEALAAVRAVWPRLAFAVTE